MNLLKRLLNRKTAKVYTLDDIKIDESLSDQWGMFSDKWKMYVSILQFPSVDKRIKKVVKFSMHCKEYGFYQGEWYSIVEIGCEHIAPYGPAGMSAIISKTVNESDFDIQSLVNSLATNFLNK